MKKRTPKFDVDAECKFSGVPPLEIEAACKYEYMRESQTLRDALKRKDFHQRPVFSSVVHDSMRPSGMYRLMFALRKAGFPKPWNKLNKNAQRKLVAAIHEWDAKRKESDPPVVIEDAVPEQDLEGERERLVGEQSVITKPKSPASATAQNAADAFIRAMRPPIWRFTPSEPELLRRGQQSQRKYFYGFIRIDEGYNETEAAEAFKKEFRKRWPKTKGGNRERWGARLKNLVVMRIWKRFPGKGYRDLYRRLNLVAKFCDYKGCVEEAAAYKERCSEGRGDQPISNAAEVEMSTARADARESFQRFFPGEEPLSW
jgi:hypothetical protein